MRYIGALVLRDRRASGIDPDRSFGMSRRNYAF